MVANSETEPKPLLSDTVELAFPVFRRFLAGYPRGVTFVTAKTRSGCHSKERERVGTMSSSPERDKLLYALRREWEFLEQGGYRAPIAWRPPFIFEDSPTCLRSTASNCTGVECPLLMLVPVEHRSHPVPCRYIPLNDAGETVDSLYRTHTQDEAEAVLRRWLISMIEKLDQ